MWKTICLAYKRLRLHGSQELDSLPLLTILAYPLYMFLSGADLSSLLRFRLLLSLAVLLCLTLLTLATH